MRLPLALVAALVVAPAQLHAQWGRDADGELQYTFDYATSITMRCAFPWDGCSAIGNVMTFRSETGTLRVTFTGTSGIFTATNQIQRLELGTLHVEEEGSFTFPIVRNDAVPVLTFSLAVNSSSPMAVTRGWALVYVDAGGSPAGSFLTGSSNDFFRLPTTPPPTPGASILQVDHGTPPQLNAATADYVLTARVGLIPEPSTWMMIGTGLLGLGAVAVGRGRRATPAPGPAARDGELPKEPLVG